jgi:hypothetical protein
MESIKAIAQRLSGWMMPKKTDLQKQLETIKYIQVLLRSKPGQEEFHDAIDNINACQTGPQIKTVEDYENDARINAIRSANQEAALSHLNYKSIGKFIDENYTTWCAATLITYLDTVLITDEKERYDIINYCIKMNIAHRTANERFIGENNFNDIEKLNESSLTITRDKPWWAFGFERTRGLTTKADLNKNRALVWCFKPSTTSIIISTLGAIVIIDKLRTIQQFKTLRNTIITLQAVNH